MGAVQWMRVLHAPAVMVLSVAVGCRIPLVAVSTQQRTAATAIRWRAAAGAASVEHRPRGPTIYREAAVLSPDSRTTVHAAAMVGALAAIAEADSAAHAAAAVDSAVAAADSMVAVVDLVVVAADSMAVVAADSTAVVAAAADIINRESR